METKDVLNKIYDFCSIREERQYVREYSNRLKYLISLVKELNIPYIIDTWDYHNEDEIEDDEVFHNLILLGEGSKAVMAHYDIIEFESDNANDNSASVINAIALKLLRPDLHIILTDSEEDENHEGAYHFSYTYKATKYLKELNLEPLADIKWVLNLELTGYGTHVAISDFGGELFDLITEKYDNILEYDIPNSDTNRLRSRVDSEVVTLYPIIDGKPNFKHFYKIHSVKDSIDTISVDDMYNFVMNFLINI